MEIVIIGLSVTSSWGNGHATTYRGLMSALLTRGHRVQFLECDKPWYAPHRDLPEHLSEHVELYADTEDLRRRFIRQVRRADLVIVGSYVPDGIAVGDWVLQEAAGVRAFYDIDTPVTLAALDRGAAEYIERRQVGGYDCYFSFTGGPVLERLVREYGARRAEPLYCSVEVDRYVPMAAEQRWTMGYLGTYSEDRQGPLETLLCESALRLPEHDFVVAGPQYPKTIAWPANVQRLDHVAPPQHPAFYAAQRCTLNITRADMRRCGYAPSVRLFEAAACGCVILSDRWEGIDRFFTPRLEILLVDDAEDVLRAIQTLDPQRRVEIAEAARARVASEHTPAHRAQAVEAAVERIHGSPAMSVKG